VNRIVWVIERREKRKRSVWRMFYVAARRYTLTCRLRDFSTLQPDAEFRIVKYVPARMEGAK
jgi:hypothetical protein